jgi:GntR family transcriptional regulator/MocR family aminotransferase
MNLALHLDRHAPVSLQDQLFEQLRQLILTGKLKPNSRVIASRFLAEQTGVSRTTVLRAYERLISEGYLETRPTVGTFVSSNALAQSRPSSAQIASSEVPRHGALYPSSFRFPLTRRHHVADCEVDFSPSRSDSTHLLPAKVWLHAIREVFEREPDGLATLQPAAGVPALRRVIVDYLAATRGIMASPEQVMIVAGRRQACALVAHAILGRGDHVIVESPGDEDILGFFKARGAELVHVPVDEQGLETDRLPDGPASLAYVTPARQNPLGGTLPLGRREALLGWAREAGAYIIEDDSDSDFHYHGTTPQPLTALDPYGLVFYTGSFAKTLGAGLGLAYLVVPPRFVDAVLAIKSVAEEGEPWLAQMVTANLLASGEYDHHLRRVRKIYLERRDCLVAALRTQFGDIRLIGAGMGTQLTWPLPDHFPSAREACEAASGHGVNVERVVCETPALDGACRYHDKALVFGYAALTPSQLRQGVTRLAEALRADW